MKTAEQENFSNACGKSRAFNSQLFEYLQIHFLWAERKKQCTPPTCCFEKLACDCNNLYQFTDNPEFSSPDTERLYTGTAFYSSLLRLVHRHDKQVVHAVSEDVLHERVRWFRKVFLIAELYPGCCDCGEFASFTRFTNMCVELSQSTAWHACFCVFCLLAVQQHFALRQRSLFA